MAIEKNPPFSRLFRRSLSATMDQHISRFGVDQPSWLSAADAHFKRVNRTALRHLNAEAVAERKRAEQLAFIRNSRHQSIEAYRDLARIARAARNSSRMEQIEYAPGQYASKRVRDCSRHELLLLADQYERKARGMLRRAAFYRTLEHQLGLAGIDEQESLQVWIDREASGGTP